MSSSDPHLSSGEPSALELFFAMAAAFMVVLVAILVGFLLPVAIGVGVVFATLAVVLAAFGAYIARVLSS